MRSRFPPAKALTDPTRRRVLELLREQPRWRRQAAQSPFRRSYFAARVTDPGKLLSLRHYLDMGGAESEFNEISVRQRLKRETAALHQQLENQLGLLDPSLDVHQYVRVLETFYGFYVPVESDVARLAAAEVPPGFPLRLRVPLIEHDLRALGLSPADVAALPLCNDRPELSCVEDLAGCLYVLEGACLGGQVLGPLLQRRLGLAKGSGAAFFAGDEERTLPRWAAIVAWLDGLPRTGASTPKIIRAATATFSAFARWAAVTRGGSSWT